MYSTHTSNMAEFPYPFPFLVSSKRYFCVHYSTQIENIPTNTEELFYYCYEKINFVFGENLYRLCLSSKYTHGLDFLENTQVTILGFWNNKFGHLLNNIPHTIQILQLASLEQPLINIPPTIKEIKILQKPKKDLLLNSKIPYDCEVFYGDTMQKYTV